MLVTSVGHLVTSVPSEVRKMLVTSVGHLVTSVPSEVRKCSGSSAHLRGDTDHQGVGAI